MQIEALTSYSTTTASQSQAQSTDTEKLSEKDIVDYLVEISDAAKAKEKKPQIQDKNLSKLVDRIKNSTLPYEKKELIIKQAWNLARVALIKGESDYATLSDKDLKEFLKMVEQMESVESQKKDMKDLIKENKKLDKLITKLVDEDKRLLADRENTETMVKAQEEIKKLESQQNQTEILPDTETEATPQPLP